MEEQILKSLANIFKLDAVDSSLTRKDIPSWDSLTHMDLISFLEKEFKVTLSMEEIVNMNSVKKIIDVIAHHQNCRINHG